MSAGSSVQGRVTGLRTRRSSPALRPTRFGQAFLGLTVLTLIGCVNYDLSLGYGLTFLLGGVWIVTAAQAGRAARTLHLSLYPPAEAVAGQPVTFLTAVTQQGLPSPVLIRAEAVQGGRRQPISTSATRTGDTQKAGGTVFLSLTLSAPERGPLQLQNVRLIAADLFGLWHAFYMVSNSAELLVTPAPELGAPPLPQEQALGLGADTQRRGEQEELAGIRPYAAGDAPRLISWKHAARTGTLMTRQYDAPAGQALLLDWESAALAGATEQRLSRLAAWVGLAAERRLPFALALPGVALPAAAGEAQVRAALRALAAFGPWPVPMGHAGRKITLPLPQPPLRFSLLALGFALLPGALYHPLWVTALIAGLLGYAAKRPASKTKWPPISPVLLAGVAVGAGVGLSAQYGTLLGQDAGTALLSVLLALKAAETRTVRDAKLLSLLGIFITSTHYFQSQGPLTALHSLVATLLLLAAAARWINPAAEVSAAGVALWSTLRRSGQLLLLAAPLTLLLFAFFPRPDGPLWRLPVRGGNQTGLADEITAGAFSKLAQNSAVAFRADFSGGPVPPPEQRYWRGPIYEAYNGLGWQQVRSNFISPSLKWWPKSPAYTYALTLEPSSKPWLLALDTPTQLPPNTILTTGFQALTLRPSSLRTRYELRSQAAQLGVSESTERLQFDLQLPAGQSPRAFALGQGWRRLAPAQRVSAALNYFAQGGFKYTLDAPTLSGQNRVDDFLFRTKGGFCEHYASAFAFLMRAAGVPTRLVGGYQGGEFNPGGGYLIVRQQDAHAWDEVWLPEQGWVRVDPTAAVAPARISANLGTALRTPRAGVAAARTWSDNLRLRLDSFQNSWNNWVVSYNSDQQRTLFSRLGLGRAAYLLGLGLLAMALLWPVLALRRAARPRDPLLDVLHDLSAKLALPREPGETASAYAQRAAQRYPAQELALREVAQLFNELRYSVPKVSQQQISTLRAKVRQIKRA